MLRPGYLARILDLFRSHPIVAILGPRQCGKTTLAKQFLDWRGRGAPAAIIDLEDPGSLAFLENPKLILEELEGLVVIDEVQRRPDLFPILRVLVDQGRRKRRFLVLGSASRDLIRQGSETLAGRIAYLELAPFSLSEVKDARRLWLRGGLPPSYLATSPRASADWLKAYISTFLERDIPALGVGVPSAALRRFWMMLAHYHGQTLNASELGRSLGVADTTIRRYVDILSGTFMVRQLPPWFENIGKRQVKAPKIYIRDSGVLHALFGVQNEKQLRIHPKLGASWEGFALESVARFYMAAPEELYFWRTHGQAELDLLLIQDGRRRGFEFKYTESPGLTPSMRNAMEDLKLDELTVVSPGRQDFPIAEGVRAVGLEALAESFRKKKSRR